MCNNLTIITHNNTTLCTSTLAKVILLKNFANFLQVYKHKMFSILYYKLQLAHVFKFKFAPTDAYMLVVTFPKVNELVWNRSIKYPLLYFSAMKLIVHIFQHIPFNKLIQTHKIQNYQVVFL